MSKLERRETKRYLEMFYMLKFRDLVSNLTFLFSSNSLVLIGFDSQYDILILLAWF